MSRWWPKRRDAAQRDLDCLEVARVLQSYLDGEINEFMAQRVKEHLEDCRRCGLEVEIYGEIKRALTRHKALDSQAVARLRAFGEALLRSTEPDDGGTTGQRSGPPLGT